MKQCIMLYPRFAHVKGFIYCNQIRTHDCCQTRHQYRIVTYKLYINGCKNEIKFFPNIRQMALNTITELSSSKQSKKVCSKISGHIRNPEK